MNLRMGRHEFTDVTIPLLWGTRGVLQDQKMRISVIDLSGPVAKLEILGDKPAPEIEFRPSSDGAIEVLGEGKPLYRYDPIQKTLRGITLRLPECQIEANGIRVGSVRLWNNEFQRVGVGVRVTESGVSMGGPVPVELAQLLT